jgi:hypothetical protein
VRQHRLIVAVLCEATIQNLLPHLTALDIEKAEQAGQGR